MRGVRAVANDLHVLLKFGRTDSDIATDAVHALEMRAAIPETVQAVVHDGRVTLTGKVGWLFEANADEETVRHITGVRAVFNHILVEPAPPDRDIV